MIYKPDLCYPTHYPTEEITVITPIRSFALSRSSVEGKKADNGKTPCELLSPIALSATAEVLGFGAKKYAAHNWRKGLVWSRILGAIFRHLLAFMQGEDLDKETGLPHIDHVACEVMFLQEFYRTRKDLDDRYKPETKGETNGI